MKCKIAFAQAQKSGWEYKKMRLAEEAELKKNKNINAFLPKTCSQSTDLQPDLPINIEDPQISNVNNSEPVAKRIKLGASINESANYVPGDPGPINDDIFSDPPKWPFISDHKIRQLIVEKGPVQIEDFDFPVENGRRFSPTFHTRRLNSCETWPTNGSSDGKHISRDLASHEKSVKHFTAFKSYREFDHRLRSKNTVDKEHKRILNPEIEHWLTQSLALRGGSSEMYARNNSNFLKLIELFAKFDLIMAEHVSRIRNEETRCHYLNNRIQNEIISLMSKTIRDSLIDMIKKAKWYSIILDCTSDKSRIEQMSIIIRSVAYNQNPKKFEVREHFLGFLPITDTTGKGLTEVILDELQKLGIALSDMRGQGYDNGANMKGKHSGVQNRILLMNPRAFFVPCSAHTLSLVVCDSASVTGQTTAVSDTRWVSRVVAMKPVRYQLGEIYDALMEISLDDKRDNLSKHEAQCLAQSIANFKFIRSVIIWFDILNQVNVESKLLQSLALNIIECCNILDRTTAFLKQYRSEESFCRILNEAKDLASELKVEPTFHPNNTVRVRRKKRNFEYEARDERVTDPKEQFRTELFYHVIDTAVISMEERFQQLQEHSNDFKFLYDIHALKSSTKEKIMKSCKNLHGRLTDGEKMDIDGIDLCDEIMNLAAMLPADQSPIEVLNFIVKNDILSVVPNIVIALRILLSLPVSVASGERSLSKLKIIKNYLRSTLSQESLVGLATISIESELCDRIDYQELIADFAKVKVRKISFQ
ncbi:zinc finger MYM-type protein 1-like [Diprion similis]|uniref:zinc finger MYM-type protein 1-like n=1 Tax=Diprion similis TaxID=362088 RepID=UPI001EF96E1F|nr:zinc finger MYM-type protein 1-like [Diprion similis]